MEKYSENNPQTSYFCFDTNDQKTENQIGLSACGPTAVKNILLALKYDQNDIPDNQYLLQQVPARVRNYDTKYLYPYLESRAKAGTIHIDLIKGIKKVKNDVDAKFFRFDPRQSPKQFQKWLLYFMQEFQAIPMLTEQLFLIGNDALHHQMVYGIDEHYIYLTNPEQKLDIQTAYKWISSDPFMIIPEDHIYSRTFENQEEYEKFQKDPWSSYQVLEQIMNITIKNQLKNRGIDIDQDVDTEKSYKGQSRYIGLTIPWGGLVGVTLFYRKENSSKLEEKIQKIGYKNKQIYLPLYEMQTEVIDVDLDTELTD